MKSLVGKSAYNTNFEKEVGNGYLGHELKKNNPLINFSENSFVNYVLKKALQSTDFDNLQKYVLTPLGL